MLPYTIQKMLDATVTFQRDMSIPDQFGADAARDWQDHITVPCKAWWMRQTARGPAHEEATPSETVPYADGGMLIPGGADVTAADRIKQVTRGSVVLFAGPLQINAVLNPDTYPLLIELAWKVPD